DHIRDVLLFDATYGQLESYANWCALDGGRRLISIFTQHLADENIEFISLLQKRNVAFDVHMENDLTTDSLKVRKPILIHTQDLPHDDVVAKRDYFALFLRTSAMAKRPD
ncbi:MAG: hypothetical protein V2A74_11080, partial [bacterium]